MIKVLFLCTGNSCRSQMAEGLLRHFGDNKFEVFSAGTNPSFVHPLAIEAMKEIGIDISNHRSKSVNEFIDQNFDYVITVCDRAKEVCPNFPGQVRKIHWSFEDPAEARGTREERMKVFRKVRDEIKEHIIAFIKEIETKSQLENASGN
ncbi:MAG: arsenate reductase ArsC [Candidatus Kryptonium sp.]|nr:arsenate reductase ArsC [Candidatus Kryptonium sp.]MCX7761666.1 arsenate reductase ArsC [Candidatus Kryptonium sp.]MDW8108086.1 arsenate reductase ArsC [Candidatus Kryptonium sp.]